MTPCTVMTAFISAYNATNLMAISEKSPVKDMLVTGAVFL